MTPFHVGMKVVCVDDDWSGVVILHEKTPSRGSVYTIRNVLADENSVGLQFEEIRNRPDHYDTGFVECDFHGRRFRPAHENRMDELRSLLVPTPSKAKMKERT